MFTNGTDSGLGYPPNGTCPMLNQRHRLGPRVPAEQYVPEPSLRPKAHMGGRNTQRTDLGMFSAHYLAPTRTVTLAVTLVNGWRMCISLQITVIPLTM